MLMRLSVPAVDGFRLPGTFRGWSMVALASGQWMTGWPTRRGTGALSRNLKMSRCSRLTVAEAHGLGD